MLMGGKKDYTVKEFMTKRVVTVPDDVTVMHCAKVMARKRVGSAVVMKREAIVGIVTENDITRRVVAAGLDPEKSKVSAIMTKGVVTVTPELPIYEAMIQLGQKKIKHLPVMRKGKLIGIITAMDMLRVQPAYIDILSYPLL